MQFAFAHTHSFPGCRVVVTEQGGPEAAVAEFSDGSVASARYHMTGQDIVLAIDPHRTSRGTKVGAKVWRLVRVEATSGWKVKERVI